jgi:hypothetical protein
MGSGNDCGIVLRHALAHADELHRRVIVNGELVIRVARSLNLPFAQCKGSVRLLRSCGRVPSPERLALCVMNDWGLEDEDIAEMWGRPTDWATQVRADAQALREQEVIPKHREYVDEGLLPYDPCPEELYRRAAEVRAKREPGWTQSVKGRPSSAQTQGGMRHFAWDGRHASFVSIRSENWSGR